MPAAPPHHTSDASAAPSRSASRWVLPIPRALERRLYFLATLVLTAWYLLDRAL